MAKQCLEKRVRISRDLVIYNLGKKGYPLTGNNYDANKKLIPTHELILATIKTDRNARLIEGLPVVISNEPPDYNALIEGALKQNLQNQVGYVLEGTLGILKKYNPYADFSALENAVECLMQKKISGNQFLTRINIPNEIECLSSNRSPEEAKWNVIGGAPYGQFEAKYKIYQNAKAKY